MCPVFRLPRHTGRHATPRRAFSRHEHHTKLEATSHVSDISCLRRQGQRGVHQGHDGSTATAPFFVRRQSLDEVFWRISKRGRQGWVEKDLSTLFNHSFRVRSVLLSRQMDLLCEHETAARRRRPAGWERVLRTVSTQRKGCHPDPIR